jgi:HK97 gp10 family phage protein
MAAITTGTVTIGGLRELTQGLAEFPAKLQKKALASALRAGGRIVRDVARDNVPQQSRRLRKSIRVTIVRRGGWITARIVAGRSVKKDDPFYAWMVEGGTKAHEIRPKGKKSLFLAGVNREIVHHPGAKARPYLGPALEAAAEAAMDAMRAELEAQIEGLR